MSDASDVDTEDGDRSNVLLRAGYLQGLATKLEGQDREFLQRASRSLILFALGRSPSLPAPLDIVRGRKICGDVDMGECLVECECGLFRGAARPHGYVDPRGPAQAGQCADSARSYISEHRPSDYPGTSGMRERLALVYRRWVGWEASYDAELMCLAIYEMAHAEGLKLGREQRAETAAPPEYRPCRICGRRSQFQVLEGDSVRCSDIWSCKENWSLDARPAVHPDVFYAEVQRAAVAEAEIERLRAETPEKKP